MRVALALVAVVAGVAALAAPAAATPSQDFVMAKQKFSTGAYRESIALIVPLLYPPPPKLNSREEEAQAHLFLAVSYYEIADFSAAEREWKEALSLEPTMTVEPPTFSDKQAQFFRERKAAYDRELSQAQRLRELEETIAKMVVIERRDAWKNFVPLGLGQFQNGHTTKGIVFFATQAAFIGANLAAYTLQGVRYGFRNGTVPPDELDTAETLQVIQIGTGAVALGLIAWGIIDAWYYYEPTVSRGVDPETLERLRNNHDDGDDNEPPTTRLRMSPTVGPDYAGAGLSFEF